MGTIQLKQKGRQFRKTRGIGGWLREKTKQSRKRPRSFARKPDDLATGCDRLRENETISRPDTIVWEKMEQSRERARSFARKRDDFANQRDRLRENGTISQTDSIFCEQV